MKLSINDPVWPAIDPGSFRHQVSLLVPVNGTDASGTVVTYQPATPAVTAWVKIDYLRGDEIIKSGQDASQVFLKLTGWYRSEFTGSDVRIQLPSGTIVLLQYAENVREMNTYMVLNCIGLGASA